MHASCWLAMHALSISLLRSLWCGCMGVHVSVCVSGCLSLSFPLFTHTLNTHSNDLFGIFSFSRHLFRTNINCFFRLISVAVDKETSLGRGGGLVVSVPAFYSDDPSSIHAGYLINYLYEKTKIKRKRGRGWPIFF